ncbi:MAG: response regulator transcription factor [Pseudoclavibacter sp.]
MSTNLSDPAPRPTSTTLSAVVVEDERDLARVVGSYLSRVGFEVHLATDGTQGVKAIREFEPDMVILDLGLPGMDGVEVCRVVRTFTDCYVLMLTARAEEVDKLIGLSVGADDYMTKPFSPRELVARVQTMLRRPRAARSTPEARPIRIAELEIDPSSREARLTGDRLQLTRTEFDLLLHLAENPKRVFTRDQLMETVWGARWSADSQLVDVHIGHLRKKLGERAAGAKYIQTIRGVGYRMGDGA